MADTPAITDVRLRVGLEVHIELATRTKVFSRAPNPAHPAWADAEPNTLTDPTVLGLPGALPVLNRAAVEQTVLLGLACNCRIAEHARWDRKGYFYPDLPKGYQISQYHLPLCGPGVFEVPATDERGFFDLSKPPTPVRINRIHLEEDAGKLLHEAPGGGPVDGSIIDLNRAGTPLVELVTEPDFSSADQAVAFARALRIIARFLGITRGVMQMGHMRFEPNINTVLTLASGRRVATPIVEVKNLNSFRALRRAIEFELARQPERFLRDGIEHAPGTKQTRGWDDSAGRTVPQREKGEAHDYRYFPDPDLPPVYISPAWRDRCAATLPELPLQRYERFTRRWGLAPAEAAALIEDRPLCDLFEGSVERAQALGVAPDRAPALVASALLHSAAAIANERSVALWDLGLTADQLASIAHLRATDRLSSNAADQLLSMLCSADHAGADPDALAADAGLLTVRDDHALRTWCEQAIAQHPQAVRAFLAGKDAAIGRIVGEVMKRSAGRADPKHARAIIESLIRP